MKKRTVTIIFSIIIVTAFGIIAAVILFPQKKETITTIPKQTSTPSLPTQAVDYRAGFAIFTNSTFRIFTASKYHNLSKDVFITAENPNIVQVKKPGITWNDFFRTLPMELTNDCLTTGTGQVFCTNESQQLSFYINGEKVDHALRQTINNGDQLLVTYGATEEEVKQQLQRIPHITPTN